MKSQQWEALDLSLDGSSLNRSVFQNVAKRLLDLLFATLGLICFLPLVVLSALLARIQSPGPIIYRAKRVGRGGRIFEMYKFRTMVANAESLGTGLTIYGDSRITKLGRFLRWTKWDEIPQFLNVIKGDMSIIGPRPEAPAYVEYYTEVQKQVLQVRPGITGPAQIANRDEEKKLEGQSHPEQYYITQLMPKKLEIDLDYIGNQSVAADLLWLLKTPFVIVFSHRC
ncbi:MAG: sugar transferase [Candidatus Poribacteria bacterium]|nr:sugar transferase [Candidatus Poribacteria bacterium]MDE0505754.1 sugar transferase [Candidatus Poribacteria bacterium]